MIQIQIILNRWVMRKFVTWKFNLMGKHALWAKTLNRNPWHLLMCLLGCNISWHRLAETANLTLAPVEEKRFAHVVCTSMFIYTLYISGVGANHGRRLCKSVRWGAWLALWCWLGIQYPKCSAASGEFSCSTQPLPSPARKWTRRAI